MSKVQKAYAITDAKISFVSLVDKAANQRQFLITKAEDNKASFTSVGKILKVDDIHHYVTGVVYEPMVEDAHGNFMTEDEIIKAAYWFSKNGDEVDLQHSFEVLEKATVVENWVTKSVTTIADETLAQGTWLITVEITDEEVWKQVEKGALTGFSMGGVGKYSAEDFEIEKKEGGEDVEVTEEVKKGIIQKMAELFGLSNVEKGEVKDNFNERNRTDGFWNAYYALSNVLKTERYDYSKDRYVYSFEDDPTIIKESLEDFSKIITSLLLDEDIIKRLVEDEKPIEKTKDKEEEVEVKKEDIQKMIDEAIMKAVNTTEQKPAEENPEGSESGLDIQKMVDEAIKKALGNDNEDDDEQDIEDIVEKAVAKAIAPILKARGLSTNLNDEKGIEKSDDHYLKGIL